VVPYLSGGFGKWIRQFDTPYQGEDTDYLTFGGGARFFINEIFSFRAEFRQVLFQDDEMTITGELPKQNLRDFSFQSLGCVRDQDPPAQQPPVECSQTYLTAFNTGTIPGTGTIFRGYLPANTGAGGFATVEFITETDDFWEARVGFDVLLGGR
jgi:hypothetical protein